MSGLSDVPSTIPDNNFPIYIHVVTIGHSWETLHPLIKLLFSPFLQNMTGGKGCTDHQMAGYIKSNPNQYYPSSSTNPGHLMIQTLNPRAQQLTPSSTTTTSPSSLMSSPGNNNMMVMMNQTIATNCHNNPSSSSTYQFTSVPEKISSSTTSGSGSQYQLVPVHVHQVSHPYQQQQHPKKSTGDDVRVS